ncbi:hypothetical protein [Methylobacterium sp.]|uniref:hypothetical protein n=1 Tax=Methylobacterium sp. TaxID=409 RepID=UPI003B02A865
MPRGRITFDQLPLFASDREIAEAVVGRDIEKVERLLLSMPKLEACGFPKRTPDGRYTPAVRDFYDRVHRARPSETATVPRQPQEDGHWKPEKKGRALHRV